MNARLPKQNLEKNRRDRVCASRRSEATSFAKAGENVCDRDPGAVVKG
jgi:hypothetical protein